MCKSEKLVLLQKSPITRSFAVSRSMSTKPGRVGSPGTVMMSPQSKYKNPAPTAARTSRTFTVWPDGAPFFEGSVDSEYLCGNQIYGAFVLNRRVDLHAIDATPARWRGDAGPRRSTEPGRPRQRQEMT